MNKRSTLKVMIADDHAVYRAGLRDLLEGAEVEVVSEAATGEEAVTQALKSKPDVVVMDVRLPGIDGIEASRQIKERLQHTEIVMVTGVEQDQDQLLHAIAAGARSYITKDEDPQVIVEAVHTASHGGAHLPADAMRQVVDSLSRLAPPRAGGPSGGRDGTGSIKHAGRRPAHRP